MVHSQKLSFSHFSQPWPQIDILTWVQHYEYLNKRKKTFCKQVQFLVNLTQRLCDWSWLPKVMSLLVLLVWPGCASPSVQCDSVGLGSGQGQRKSARHTDRLASAVSMIQKWPLRRTASSLWSDCIYICNLKSADFHKGIVFPVHFTLEMDEKATSFQGEKYSS